MPPAARLLRIVVVAALVGAFAALWGGEAFWICVPAALVLAAAEPRRRGALAAAALVVAAAALAAPPDPLPALVVVPTSVATLLVVRVRLERERDTMRRYALRDPLTGLANRRALDERLGYEIARHTRQAQPFAVLALDLDGFKGVNDRFGHDAGDALLREIAGALESAVREQDTVVRLGGDEFCVLAPQTDEQGAVQLTHRVRASLREVTTGLEAVGASIGAATFPEDGSEPGLLLAAADAGALEAKREVHARRGGTARRAAA